MDSSPKTERDPFSQDLLFGVMLTGAGVLLLLLGAAAIWRGATTPYAMVDRYGAVAGGVLVATQGVGMLGAVILPLRDRDRDVPVTRWLVALAVAAVLGLGAGWGYIATHPTAPPTELPPSPSPPSPG